MKKTLLASIVVLSNSFFASAQTTLYAANSNPVAGYKFYTRDFDLDTASEGSAGMSIVWDFSGCYDLGVVDSNVYYNCSSGVCDSFPGSNMFTVSGYGDTTFFIADTLSFGFTGYAYAGEWMSMSNPIDIQRYPLTWNTIFLDTGYGSIPAYSYSYWQRDSVICDGYGTLELPGRTESGVLRLHKFSLQVDSSSSGVDTAMYELFTWMKPGIRSPILEITYDTTGGTLYRSATYYSENIDRTSVANISANGLALQLYPNPASDKVTISFLPLYQDEATISIFDMTGRAVMTKKFSQLELAENKCDLNLQEIATGRYLVRLSYAAGSVQAPLVVTK